MASSRFKAIPKQQATTSNKKDSLKRHLIEGLNIVPDSPFSLSLKETPTVSKEQMSKCYHIFWHLNPFPYLEEHRRLKGREIKKRV